MTIAIVRRSADRQQRLVSMWIAGEKFSSIATELGISRTATASMAQRIGLPPRPNKMRCNMWPNVVAWIRAGYSPVEIVDAMRIVGKARSIALGRMGNPTGFQPFPESGYKKSPQAGEGLGAIVTQQGAQRSH